MAGDALRQILAHIRAELPDTPEETWEKIELALRRDLGGTRQYIAAHAKRNALEVIAQASEDTSAEQLAKLLGVSPRRVRQLKQLR